MRISEIVVCFLAVVVVTGGGGCATQRCLEGYGAMTTAQVVRRDGEILTSLVEKRRAAAQELQTAGDQSSRSGDLRRSVQAWEMAMSVVVQLQNLSRRDENAERLAENGELLSNIRCLATAWIDRDGHIVSAGEGMRMLGHQRDLEEVFGEQGRPTDTELSAIAEGREIYMGPTEEEIDVPEAAEGTGPSEAGSEPSEEGGEGAEGGDAEPEGEAGAEGAGGEAGDEGEPSIDDLLGE